MAPTAALALRDPAMPIIRGFEYTDLAMAKLEHEFPDGAGGAAARKARLPAVQDATSKERLVYATGQCIQAPGNTRLNLADADLYSKFRGALAGGVLLQWQVAIQPRAVANRTAANFAAGIRTLITYFAGTTAFHDQKEYLDTVAKPFKLAVSDTSSRLRAINALTGYLPGAPAGGNATVYNTEVEFKRAFLRMMPQQWKIQFALIGHDAENATYGFMDLVRFMQTQEALPASRGRNNQSDGKRKSANQGGTSRGNPTPRTSNNNNSNRNTGGGRGNGGGRGSNNFRGNGSGRGGGYNNNNRGNFSSPTGYFGTPRSAYGGQGNNTPRTNNGGGNTNTGNAGRSISGFSPGGRGQSSGGGFNLQPRYSGPPSIPTFNGFSGMPPRRHPVRPSGPPPPGYEAYWINNGDQGCDDVGPNYYGYGAGWDNDVQYKDPPEGEHGHDMYWGQEEEGQGDY